MVPAQVSGCTIFVSDDFVCELSGRYALRRLWINRRYRREAGKRHPGFFARMAAVSSIWRRCESLRPELIQKQSKSRTGFGDLLSNHGGGGVLIRLFKPLVELEHSSRNMIVIGA
jgi:hypothetical protein